MWLHSHQPCCSLACQSMNVPRPQTPALSPHPNCAGAGLPSVHRSSRPNITDFMSSERAVAAQRRATPRTCCCLTLWLLSHFVPKQLPLLFNDCGEERSHRLYVMSTLRYCTCVRAWATVWCWSSPVPPVPAPSKRTGQSAQTGFWGSNIFGLSNVSAP